MDKNTKIGLAVVGWMFINIAGTQVELKRRVRKLEARTQKLVEAHNNRVFNEKFVNIVQNYDRY